MQAVVLECYRLCICILISAARRLSGAFYFCPAEKPQNGAETILKGAEGETIPKKNKNTAELKCVRVVVR